MGEHQDIMHQVAEETTSPRLAKDHKLQTETNNKIAERLQKETESRKRESREREKEQRNKKDKKERKARDSRASHSGSLLSGAGTVLTEMVPTIMPQGDLSAPGEYSETIIKSEKREPEREPTSVIESNLECGADAKNSGEHQDIMHQVAEETKCPKDQKLETETSNKIAERLLKETESRKRKTARNRGIARRKNVKKTKRRERLVNGRKRNSEKLRIRQSSSSRRKLKFISFSKPVKPSKPEEGIPTPNIMKAS